MMRPLLIANIVLLVALIGLRVGYGPFVIYRQHCPSIEITERPGPQPDLFKRNAPQGVEI